MRMARLAAHDVDTLFARALVADAALHGIAATVLDWHSHPWYSATFVGARHTATLRIEGDATGWFAALPENEFVLRGHLVADIVARLDGPATVKLEALTLVYA